MWQQQASAMQGFDFTEWEELMFRDHPGVQEDCLPGFQLNGGCSWITEEEYCENAGMYWFSEEHSNTYVHCRWNQTDSLTMCAISSSEFDACYLDFWNEADADADVPASAPAPAPVQFVVERASKCKMIYNGVSDACFGDELICPDCSKALKQIKEALALPCASSEPMEFHDNLEAAVKDITSHEDPCLQEV